MLGALRPTNRADQRQLPCMFLQEMAELFGEESSDGELESEPLVDTVFQRMQSSEDFAEVTIQSAPDSVVSFDVCGCCSPLLTGFVDKSCCYSSFSSGKILVYHVCLERNGYYFVASFSGQRSPVQSVQICT